MVGEMASQFDNLCKLAALICKVTKAVLVLKEGDGFRSNASFGINEQTFVEINEYNFSIEWNYNGIFEIADALEISDVKQHAFFKEKPRFYACFPLTNVLGVKIGLLCVFGAEPKVLTSLQKEAMLTLTEEVKVHFSLKQREEELQAKAERFEEMFSMSAIAPEIHCILDFSGRVLFINQAVFLILGYTVKEAIGMLIWDVFHKDDVEKIVGKLEAGLKISQKDFKLDFRTIAKSGAVRWISWRLVIRDDRWFAFGRDITESKKLESELLNLSFVASKVNNAIVINDPNDHVTWVNAAFEKITGFTLEDLKGKRLGDLIAGPLTDLALIENARDLNRRNQSFSLDLLAYRKDKKPIWISIFNTVVFDEAGKVSAEVEIIIDITDKKLAEQEMLEAKEQALQLSEAKEMFLSVMSHEIRTPLNAILGMTQLLLENDPKPAQVDDLNILKFSGDNLLNIVNDILDFTKMETGNLQLEAIPFNLHMLANDIVNSLQVNVSKKQNTLQLIYDDRIPERMIGDKTRLYQVLMNLLGNALKFTKNGLVTLNVALKANHEQEVEIFFEVKDSGIGIPKDKLNYIFEPFTQAKTDISRKYGGTGLGLAITKKVLELYGAQIMVESEEGNGATFYFTIAFDKIPINKPADYRMDEIPSAFSNKKILVVDDNEINALIAQRILIKWGIAVDLAYSGLEAIEKLKNRDYNLVFMDLNMPDLDGYETAALIRKLDGDYFRDLPVIALTAQDITDEEALYKENLMNGYLLKPLNMTALRELMIRYLAVN